MMKRIILSVVLFCWVVNLKAQDYSTSITSYTLEDGLSHNQIDWLHKDKQGMLWVGTFNGINRYDGQAFKYVAKADFSHVSHPNILEDEEGDLWLIENREKRNLFFFNTITEEVRTFEEKFGKQPPFQKEKYANAVMLANKTILVATTDHNYVSILPNQKVQKYEQDLSQLVISAHPQSNQYWLTNPKTAILKDENHLEQYQFQDIPAVQNIISVNAENQLIYIGLDNVVYTLTPLGQITKHDLDYIEDVKDLHSFYYSRDQAEDRILQLNVKGNFRIYDFENPRTLLLKKYFKELEVSSISSVLKDDENVWVGTINGLLKIQVLPNYFKRGLFKNPKLHPQLAFNSCRGIMESEDGQIYVTTRGGIINVKNEKPFLKRVDYSFHSMLLTRDSILWTNYNHRNYRNDLQTGELQIFEMEDSTIPEGWSFFQDIMGTIWVGTAAGLTCYENGYSKFKKYQKTNAYSTIESSIIYEFFIDQQGLIWLPTSSGLYQLDIEEGVIERYWKKGNGKFKFPSDRLQHIHQDKDGIFWIASRDGLVRWDKKNSETQLFSDQNGFTNSNLNAVFEDDFGFLWMSSDNGIIQFQKETFKVKNYNLRDGITHPEFNRISHFQDANGFIYFGGLNGVTYFHPRDFVALFNKPVNTPLVLTECKIFSGEKEKQEDRFVEARKNNKIVLAPDDRYLMLQFASLDYYNANKTTYSYEIDGETWGTTKGNSINISALSYGSHTLTVKARTGIGLFSSQVLSIPIEVLRPFYLQYWFLAVSGLFLLSAVYIFQKMRTRAFIQRQKELETTVAERTQTIQIQSEKLKELDKAKSKFLANISHELRTPLTLILNTLKNDQIEKILNRTDQQTKFAYDEMDVNIMYRNADRLQQLIDQLLDLSKLEAGKVTLKASQENFKTYLEEIVKTFRTTAQKKNIDLTFSAKDIEMPIYFERDKMDKVIYNLLANAIKFTPINGKIEVQLWQKETALFFTIKDNGIGIPKEDLENIFNRFYQVKRQDKHAYEGTGLGLALVKEFIEIHSGKVKVHSEVSMGTCFEIALPIGEAHLKVEEKEQTKSFLPKNSNHKVGTQELEFTLENQEIESTPNSRPILLIIEDNGDLRYHHQKMFSADYQIVLAQNGMEGLEKAFEIIPDIIVCDVMMPIKDGYEVCQTLKSDEKTNHIPVILLTAKVRHLDKMEGLTVGADDYISKPYDQRELSLRIRNLLEHTRQLQKQFSLQQQGLILNKPILTPQDKFIEKLNVIVEENLSNRNFGVVELSEILLLSRSQLFRKLKAITGGTPSSFIRTYRLNRAKELLIEEDGNATNVSYLVGFNHPNYFFRCFKNEFGMTPGQYMEQILS